jgi:hypothetical protein
MKYIGYILPFFVIALFSYLFFGMAPADKKVGQSVSAPQPTQQGEWQKKTDEQGGVLVAVTPLSFGKDAVEWKFGVVFTTHTGSLNQDPREITTLVDDKGNVYKPESWEGAGPGGHHREGTLVFKAINPSPTFVELKIKDIGGIPERTFRWDL